MNIVRFVQADMSNFFQQFVSGRRICKQCYEWVTPASIKIYNLIYFSQRYLWRAWQELSFWDSEIQEFWSSQDLVSGLRNICPKHQIELCRPRGLKGWEVWAAYETTFWLTLVIWHWAPIWSLGFTFINMECKLASSAVDRWSPVLDWTAEHCREFAKYQLLINHRLDSCRPLSLQTSYELLPTGYLVNWSRDVLGTCICSSHPEVVALRAERYLTYTFWRTLDSAIRGSIDSLVASMAFSSSPAGQSCILDFLIAPPASRLQRSRARLKLN